MAPQKRNSRNQLPHQCLFCLKIYQGYNALQTHMNLHTGEHPYQCTKCPANFTDHRYLGQHIAKVHHGKKFICGGCHMEYYSQGTLNRHRNMGYCSGVTTKTLDSSKIEGGTIKGTFKMLKTETFGKIREESEAVNRIVGIEANVTVTPTPPTEPEPQSSKKVEKSSLGTLSHSRNQLPHQCLFCSKVCQDYSDLEGHMKFHTRENHQGTLARHQNRGHWTTGVKKGQSTSSKVKRKFPAGKIRKVNKNAGKFKKDQKISGGDTKTMALTLNLHTLKSEAVGNKSCGPPIQMKMETGKQFIEQLIKTEEIIDRNRKPVGVTKSSSAVFKCSHCPTTYLDRNSLLRHAADFHGQKTFECPICKNLYTQYQNMTRHLRIAHVDQEELLKWREERNTCNSCSKTFSNSTLLLEHKKMEHNLKTFKCTYCTNEYTLYSNMVRHLKKSHGEGLHEVKTEKSQLPVVYTTVKETGAEKKTISECSKMSAEVLEQNATKVDQFPVYVNGKEAGSSEGRLDQNQGHQQLMKEMVTQFRIQKERKFEEDLSFFLHLNRYDPSSV